MSHKLLNFRHLTEYTGSFLPTSWLAVYNPSEGTAGHPMIYDHRLAEKPGAVNKNVTQENKHSQHSKGGNLDSAFFEFENERNGCRCGSLDIDS